MSGRRKLCLHGSPLFLQNFADPVRIRKVRMKKNLLRQLQRLLQIRIHCFQRQLKQNPVLRRLPAVVHIRNRRENPSRFDADFVIQLLIGILLRAHGSKENLEDSDIPEKLRRKTCHIKGKIQIIDAVCLCRMRKKRKLLPAKPFRRRLLRLRLQIQPRKHRNAADRFFGIRRILPGPELLFLPSKLLQFLPGKGRGKGSKLLPLLLLHPLRKALFRKQEHRARMRVVQKVSANQLFKISGMDFLLQLLQKTADIQIRPDGRLVVKPGIQKIQSVNQSLGIRAEIRLPVMEFEVIDSGKNCPRIHSVLRQILQRFADGTFELLLLLRLGIFCRDRVVRLIDAALIKRLHILPDALFAKSLLHRSAFCVAEHIIQHLEGKDHLRIPVYRECCIPGKERLFVLVILLQNAVALPDLCRLFKRLLRANGGINRQHLIVCKVLLIQKPQPLCDIQIPVEKNVGVGRMIVLPVEVQILLIGKLRNHLRIAARDNRIRGIRIQGSQNLIIQHIIRGRHHPLHLIVNNTVDQNLRCLLTVGGILLHLIMPALLPENILIGIDVRMEYGVQIHVHQIGKILLIGGSHRIHRLVRVRHCIQEGIQRSLHNLNERILDRKIPRPAQNRMLNDMSDSRRIRRRCTERNVKDLVAVLVRQKRDSRPALLMPQHIAVASDVLQKTMLQDLVCPKRTNLRLCIVVHEIRYPLCVQ